MGMGRWCEPKVSPPAVRPSPSPYSPSPRCLHQIRQWCRLPTRQTSRICIHACRDEAAVRYWLIRQRYSHRHHCFPWCHPQVPILIIKYSRRVSYKSASHRSHAETSQLCNLDAGTTATIFFSWMAPKPKVYRSYSIISAFVINDMPPLVLYLKAPPFNWSSSWLASKVKEPSADFGRHNNQNKEYTMQDDTTIIIQNTIHNVEVEYLKVVESTIAKSLPQWLCSLSRTHFDWVIQIIK